MSLAYDFNEYKEAKKTPENDIIAFALKCAEPDEGFAMLMEFKKVVMIENGTEQDIQAWFKSRGFEVSLNDCRLIIENKDKREMFKHNMNEWMSSSSY